MATLSSIKDDWEIKELKAKANKSKKDYDFLIRYNSRIIMEALNLINQQRTMKGLVKTPAASEAFIEKVNDRITQLENEIALYEIEKSHSKKKTKVTSRASFRLALAITTVCIGFLLAFLVLYAVQSQAAELSTDFWEIFNLLKEDLLFFAPLVMVVLLLVVWPLLLYFSIERARP